VQDGGEDVAPLVVAAQGEGEAPRLVPQRRDEGVVEVERREVERILRREPRRAERAADASQGGERGGDGDGRPAEAVRQVARPGRPENQFTRA
jgi:hypothetical protein